MVTEVTERALAHVGKKELLLTGGVAANKRLQAMIRAVAEEHRVKYDAVETEFSIDNGAMIAWTGVLAYRHGLTTPLEKSFVRMKWRLEEVEVPWMR
jgi:N6-L-threonylcarbamoyladenine synthase